ncbi:hypothetical protein HDU92_002492 [Lobulomyces angularis]|nr:hypothetical protein HDU92_002492 [Lobulomyces angularis]
MSQDSYRHPTDIETIWNSTSKWRPTQIEILRAKFIDTSIDNIVENANIDNLILQPILNKIILPNINLLVPPSRKDVPEEQLIFFNKLMQLNKFRDEPPVDAIAYELLNNIGYEGLILHFRPKPHLEFKWQGYEIASVPDYGVYVGDDIEEFAEYLLIVKDKPAGKYSYLKGECQLFGEMITAAINNYIIKKEQQNIYGMTIRGSYIKFYLSMFDKEYLSNIINDKKPTKDVNIYRYPSDDSKGLSLNSTQERLHIVKILKTIKEIIESKFK